MALMDRRTGEDGLSRSARVVQLESFSPKGSLFLAPSNQPAMLSTLIRLSVYMIYSISSPHRLIHGG